MVATRPDLFEFFAGSCRAIPYFATRSQRVGWQFGWQIFSWAPATQWLSQPIDNTAENLRNAVWHFVERHQHEKLEKHVRRGNLNGLPNFLDIFRSLNGILITFNKRMIKGVPVIPHPFVTTGIMANLDLLMGSADTEGEYVPGYIDSINANFQGDRELVRERLLEERVPQFCLPQLRP